MEEKFTIEEIRNYIIRQDSFGDVLYNLSSASIIYTNTQEDEDEDEDFYNFFLG
jgi:hypothetical protein